MREARGEVGKFAPNLLQQEFYAEKPNQKWVTNVTEFSLFGQKLYLSALLDLQSSYLISYTVSERSVLRRVTSINQVLPPAAQTKRHPSAYEPKR